MMGFLQMIWTTGWSMQLNNNVATVIMHTSVDDKRMKISLARKTTVGTGPKDQWLLHDIEALLPNLTIYNLIKPRCQLPMTSKQNKVITIIVNMSRL